MNGFFFDARFIKVDRPDGISRFALGLLRELRSQLDVTVMVSSKEQQELIGGSSFVMLPEVTSPKEIFTAFKLNRLGAKVVFSPMQTTSGLGRRFKLILTLHDLIYYRHRTPPREFNPAIRFAWFLFHLSYLPQRIILNSSDAVVTVSKTSKSEIERVKLTKRPISVVYNASDLGEGKPTNQASSNYVVYMGSFIGYKNVETLIRAVALSGLELVLLSKITPAREQKLRLLASNFGSKVRFIGGVSDREYVEFLQGARALVSASKDEGFGIPVVEAMGQGIPVVISDIEIFREIAEEAGSYFAPQDEHSLAAHLSALGDPATWAKFSRLGLSRSTAFSWTKSASELATLVRSLST